MTTKLEKTRNLRLALWIIGAGWTCYWLTLFVNELSGLSLWDRTSWIAPFVMWGQGGHEYLVMLCSVNLVLGAYMMLSARDPIAHHLFVDFSLAANGFHLAGMAVMAAHDPMEHTKLLGDVPLGSVPMLLLTALWLPVRPRAGALLAR